MSSVISASKWTKGKLSEKDRKELLSMLESKKIEQLQKRVSELEQDLESNAQIISQLNGSLKGMREVEEVLNKRIQRLEERIGIYGHLLKLIRVTTDFIEPMGR